MPINHLLKAAMFVFYLLTNTPLYAQIVEVVGAVDTLSVSVQTDYDENYIDYKQAYILSRDFAYELEQIMSDKINWNTDGKRVQISTEVYGSEAPVDQMEYQPDYWCNLIISKDLVWAELRNLEKDSSVLRVPSVSVQAHDYATAIRTLARYCMENFLIGKGISTPRGFRRIDIWNASNVPNNQFRKQRFDVPNQLCCYNFKLIQDNHSSYSKEIPQSCYLGIKVSYSDSIYEVKHLSRNINIGGGLLLNQAGQYLAMQYYGSLNAKWQLGLGMTAFRFNRETSLKWPDGSTADPVNYIESEYLALGGIQYQAYEPISNTIYTLEMGLAYWHAAGYYGRVSLAHANFSALRLQFSYYDFEAQFIERTFSLFEQTAIQEETPQRINVPTIGIHYHRFF